MSIETFNRQLLHSHTVLFAALRRVQQLNPLAGKQLMQRGWMVWPD